MSKIAKCQVIVDVSPQPNVTEKTAAGLVADFLKKDVRFIQKGFSKSPDLLIGNQMWEIKAPIGAGPHTIMHQFQRASRQAKYLVFDARRIKISDEACLKRVQREFGASRTIRRVIYIGKDGTVKELKK